MVKKIVEKILGREKNPQKIKVGLKHGVHKVVNVVKNSSDETIAVSCNCCAHMIFHPVDQTHGVYWSKRVTPTTNWHSLK